MLHGALCGARLFCLAALAGCAFDGSGLAGGEAPDAAGISGPEALRVSGAIRDFRRPSAALGGNLVRVSGLSPPPMLELIGTSFEITQVPPESLLLISATSSGHRPSRISLPVRFSPVGGVDIPLVAEEDLAAYAAAFGFDPEKGLLLARAVDAQGQPAADVEGEAFQMVALSNSTASARGPLFLDEALDPDASLTRTSGSGYFFFADLQPGSVSLSGREPYDVRMTPVEVGEGTIAIADVEVSQVSSD